MSTSPPDSSAPSGSDGAYDGATPDANSLDAAQADAQEAGLADGPTDAVSDAVSEEVQFTPPSGDAAVGEPSCDPSAKLGSPTPVPGIPSFSTQPFITMTNDELTMAWVVPGSGEGDGGVGGVGVYVADRTSTTDPFGTALEVYGILDGASFFAFDRVAISGDGLTLTAVEDGARNMASFVRTARGEAFAPFELLSPYEAITQSLEDAELLGDPVVSSDNEDLVFSVYGQGALVTVFESIRTGSSAWPTPTPRGSMALQASNGDRERPLSMTADRLTLFVWDTGSSSAYGVFRNSATGNYTTAEPYGPLFSLQTNGACTAFYYVAQTGSTYTVEQVQTM